jgi:hypothetical protein
MAKEILRVKEDKAQLIAALNMLASRQGKSRLAGAIATFIEIDGKCYSPTQENKETPCKKIFKHAQFTAVFTDENGYFSFTGDCKGSGGACSDKIIEIAPELAPLNDLHLCDVKTGAPMHGFVNAAYHLKEGQVDTAIRCLSCPEDMASVFIKASSEWEQIRSEINAGNQGRLIVGVLNAITNVLEGVKSEIESFWQDRADEVENLLNELPSNMTNRFISPYDDEGNILLD